jgi:hypothetical protein
MNLLSLNCRGLGLDAAVGELRDLCRSYNPAVVFLCETKKEGQGDGENQMEFGAFQWCGGEMSGKEGRISVMVERRGGGVSQTMVSVLHRRKDLSRWQDVEIYWYIRGATG